MSTSEDRTTGATGTMDEQASWVGASDVRGRFAAPAHGEESARTYHGGNSAIAALLFALVMDAAVIGLFMFITWFAYATD